MDFNAPFISPHDALDCVIARPMERRSGAHPPAGRGLQVVPAARGLNKSATVQHRQFNANGPTPQLGVMRRDRRYGSLLSKRSEGRKEGRKGV